ncbi:MAG TPA: DUF4867 family protein [Candidatus Limivivens intestinipullorum]|uniref:DUF4867 family protein n=1 Tax=Candidatus Limivivens intestinipullorum TaxID=2840858 RepID=A0A9D1EUK3_9FIRM|nr:DUF4867 family protein [Candidatus Limivivens intestinipullorum]
MHIYKVTDPEFRKYGRVIKNVDVSELAAALKKTELPEGVVYEPSVAALEALPVYEELQKTTYGELPIQIGYCNGHNCKMDAMEYHRSSEINVAGTDAILLLGLKQDVEEDFTYDSAKAEAFFLPEGTAIEVYATTLHYAPCSAKESGFQVGIVLPKDTNLPLGGEHKAGDEDALLTARNKWLIAHPDAKIEGAFNGIRGENITVDYKELL